jgi:flagellar protein FliO/FliZ
VLASVGIESSVAQYLIAFSVVLALLAAFGYAARRWMQEKSRIVLPERRNGQKPRISVLDVYDLDARRQLVLLRRDNVEHLLLIGGTSDVLIESHILRPGANLRPKEEAKRDETDPTESLLSSPAISMGVEEVAQDGRRKAAAILRPVLKREAAPVDEAVDVPVVVAPTAIIPLKVDSEKNLKPTSPPAVLAQSEPPVLAQSENAEPLVTKENPAEVNPISIQETNEPSETPRSLDAALLSDMAKQLEEALRKTVPDKAITENSASEAVSSTIIPPSRIQDAKLKGEPVKDETVKSISAPQAPTKPLRPVLATRSRPSQPEPIQEKEPVPTIIAPKIRDRVEEKSIPEPVLVTPASQAQPPLTSVAANITAPASPSPSPAPQMRDAKPVRDAKPDPFSIDEIEAEFARLLGREPGKS